MRLSKSLVFVLLLLGGCLSLQAEKRITARYCEIPTSARLGVRYAVENDLVCKAGYVTPAGASIFIGLYCRTQFTRPAVKALVQRDICGTQRFAEEAP